MFDVSEKKNIIALFGQSNDDVIEAAEAFSKIERHWLANTTVDGTELETPGGGRLMVYNWLTEPGQMEAAARETVLLAMQRDQVENPKAIPVLILSCGYACLRRGSFKTPITKLMFLTTQAIGVERENTTVSFTVVRSRTNESFRTGMIADRTVIWDNTHAKQ